MDLAREIAQTAATFGLHLRDDEVEMFTPLVESALRVCRQLDEIDLPRLPVRYPRDSGQRPPIDDNPFNAWAWRCSVQGSDGPLRGKRIVVKDTIPVASMPMQVGSAILDGHVASIDATVVSRVLDAGAEIVGIGATEDLCYAASSVSAVTGPVQNPWDRTRSAGGSSSGVAALIASGDADIGIGGDQGGSVRIPASLCGVFGLKPTFGLVPYSGCASSDPSLDHLGPICRTVLDMALFLENVGGADGANDPRQPQEPRLLRYSADLDEGVDRVRVGIVEEGFGWEGISESDVDSAVREAALSFERLGAIVRPVSIPEHRGSLNILVPMLMHSVADFVLRGDGMGVGIGGYHDVEMLAAFADGRRRNSDRLFDGVKLAAIIGGYLRTHYGSVYYAKASNLALQLRTSYEEALGTVDLLVMPTTPAKATPLPTRDATQEEWLLAGEAQSVVANTGAANLTGHPALSVPIGPSHGLPIGMMLVARHWEEGLLLRAARALEDRGLTATLPAASTADERGLS